MSVIQRTPDLAVGIRLQRSPEPPAPAIGGACDADALAWTGLGFVDAYGGVSHPFIGRGVSSPGGSSGVPVAVFAGMDLADWVGTRRLIGMPLGEACGVRWEWEWSIPPTPSTAGDSDVWWDGHVTRTLGTLLLVEILPGYRRYEVSWLATLTAVAWCGNRRIGELVLELGQRE